MGGILFLIRLVLGLILVKKTMLCLMGFDNGRVGNLFPSVSICGNLILLCFLYLLDCFTMRNEESLEGGLVLLIASIVCKAHNCGFREHEGLLLIGVGKSVDDWPCDCVSFFWRVLII